MVHAGQSMCAADASASAAWMRAGWGFTVGGGLSAAAWSPAIQAAFADGCCSNSPLEILAALYALFISLRDWDTLGLPERLTDTWTWSRSENLSACFVSRSSLSTRPLMALWARLQREVEAQFGVRFGFIHTARERNVVPELHSRGDVPAAKKKLREADLSWIKPIVLGEI